MCLKHTTDKQPHFLLSKLDTVSTLADKKIICSYVDTPASGSTPSSDGTIEAFCRAGDRMTLALGKIDSSAGTVLCRFVFVINTTTYLENIC